MLHSILGLPPKWFDNTSSVNYTSYGPSKRLCRSTSGFSWNFPLSGKQKKNVLSLEAGRFKSEREKAELSIHPNSLMREITASPLGRKDGGMETVLLSQCFWIFSIITKFPQGGHSKMRWSRVQPAFSGQDQGRLTILQYEGLCHMKKNGSTPNVNNNPWETEVPLHGNTRQGAWRLLSPSHINTHTIDYL